MLHEYQLVENPIETGGGGGIFWLVRALQLWFLLLAALIVWLFAGFDEAWNISPGMIVLLTFIALIVAILHWGNSKASRTKVIVDKEGIRLSDGKRDEFLAWSRFSHSQMRLWQIDLYDKGDNLCVSLPPTIARLKDILPILVDAEICQHKGLAEDALRNIPTPLHSRHIFSLLADMAFLLVLLGVLYHSYGKVDGIMIGLVAIAGLVMVAGKSWRISVNHAALEAQGFHIPKTIPLSDIENVVITLSRYPHECIYGVDKRLKLTLRGGSTYSLNVEGHEWMTVYLAVCRATGKLDRLLRE